jgi:uncharacterized membrane protein
MDTTVLPVVVSLVSMVVLVIAWRALLAERSQAFDRERIRKRWATASVGRRITTLLGVPLGFGLGYLLIQAERTGAFPLWLLWIIRLVLAVLVLFGALRLSKQLTKERNEERNRTTCPAPAPFAVMLSFLRSTTG